MLIEQQYKLTTLFEMPHKTRRTASPLRKHRPAERLHRFHVVRVEIGVFHIPVEPADIIAPRDQTCSGCFVIPVMARDQDHSPTGGRGLFER